MPISINMVVMFFMRIKLAKADKIQFIQKLHSVTEENILKSPWPKYSISDFGKGTS